MNMVSSMEPPQVKSRVMINPAPFYHIYGVITGLILPLFEGIPSVIMGKFDLLELFQNIQTYRVDLVWVVPPIALGLLGHPRRLSFVGVTWIVLVITCFSHEEL